MSMSRAAKQRGLPPLVREMVGVAVVTTRDLENGYMRIPAGTRGRITSASLWTKLRFRGEACTCCGVAPTALLDVLAIEADRTVERAA